jgi:hypothetical protein
MTKRTNWLRGGLSPSRGPGRGLPAQAASLLPTKRRPGWMVTRGSCAARSAPVDAAGKATPSDIKRSAGPHVLWLGRRLPAFRNRPSADVNKRSEPDTPSRTPPDKGTVGRHGWTMLRLMNRDEAMAEVERRRAADPTVSWIASERDGDWVVVRIGVAPTTVTGTATKPPPVAPQGDPHSAIERAAWFAGGGG